jgi:hypothetical protein
MELTAQSLIYEIIVAALFHGFYCFRKFQKMKSSKEGYRTINEVELFEGSFPTAMPQR